jgi:hypothetical protein
MLSMRTATCIKNSCIGFLLCKIYKNNTFGMQYTIGVR